MRYIRYLVIFTSILILVPSPARSGEKAGDVVSVKGRSLIERGEEIVKAARNLELFEEDIVTTEIQSRIKMLFRDDSILTLGESSRLSVKRYLYDADSRRAESVYEIIDGTLRSVVGNASFRVKTPTALAAARGTVFIVWYEKDTDATGLAVIEGEVGVQNIDPNVEGFQIVNSGMMTLIKRGTAPSLPEAFRWKNKLLQEENGEDTSEVSVAPVNLPEVIVVGIDGSDVDVPTLNDDNPDYPGKSKGPQNYKARGIPHDQVPNPGKRLGQEKP